MQETGGASCQYSPAWNALYDAHVLYIKELAIVYQSFCIFRVAGINTNTIKGPGREFVRFSAMLGQRSFAVGITSLFERKDEGTGLCSVRGLLSLTEGVPLLNQRAHVQFVEKYGIAPTDDWMKDVVKVLEKAGPIAQKCLSLTKKLRNTRIAHLEQPQREAPPAMLPSIDDCEKIIRLAYDFYLFIACGFLHSNGAALEDRAGTSLLQLLHQRFDCPDAKYDLPLEAVNNQAN